MNNQRARIRNYIKVLMQQEDSRGDYPPVWSHLGLNQGPPDYESGATNQLSYGTPKSCIMYYV